jgi:hypothetical protein
MSRSARIRTLCGGFGDRPLSQEHAPIQGVRGESNPPPRPSQGRMQNRYTTDTINSPGWIRTSDLSHVTGMSCPLNDGTVSTPTRIRTRNASFEARYDGPFHHRGVERKARESNPHLRWENRLSRAARPTVSGYLPFNGPTGNRTRISSLPNWCRPVGP